MQSITTVILPFLAYALGSIPFGLAFTRLFTPVDIRHAGSGNIGATNVKRLAGTTLGLLTLVADVAKGLLPVLYAWTLPVVAEKGAHGYLSLIILAAVGGHLFPLYLKFRQGGKGVATALGCFLAVTPLGAIVLLLVFVLVVCITSRVSAGSITASVLLPLVVWKSSGSGILTACSALISIAVICRHHDNIKRLLKGTEPPL